MNPVTANPSTPAPFFTDPRTLIEKLTGEKREWRPHEPERECPAVLFGLVLERGKYYSDYTDSDNNPRVHETALILDADNVEWSVIAFHGYLAGEFDRKQPQVGDFVAIAFRGTKPAKRSGESDPYDYLMAVERNPATSVTASEPSVDELPNEEPATGGGQSEEGGDDDSIPY